MAFTLEGTGCRPSLLITNPRNSKCSLKKLHFHGFSFSVMNVASDILDNNLLFIKEGDLCPSASSFEFAKENGPINGFQAIVFINRFQTWVVFWFS
ncbi:hypothetical protein DSO57_1008670 [Entomophthora muscae]|uniref:Uncharacterized protein n=1 Tax=Entomophthora muscae TaxID=34485 RepID=A0ACC2T721_9FUNG|nr:hypothetical protein DSO57_1008670 [Entomophthora muscae]